MKVRLVSLEATIQDQAAAEAGRQTIIDQLHSQLQEARADLVWKILRPVLLDLIALQDGLAGLVRRSESGQSVPAAVLQDLYQEVLDVLERNGVTPFSVEGNCFDARRQQATRTQEAATADEVGLVVDRLSAGFSLDGRVLRPEKVTVLAHSGKKQAPRS